HAIYGRLDPADCSPAFLTSRAILTPKNIDVHQLNELVLTKFPGMTYEFTSADTMPAEEDQIVYPPEFLNAQDPSSLPPHHLKLKIGCPIMLLRILDTANGLCNGTPLICRSFQRYLMEAEIATGVNIGAIVLIPRISLIPTAEQSAMEFKRTQFPIRLAFAMTINKAQGQTFDQVGMYLATPVFTHGLLYVAMSRVRTPSSIKILIDPRIAN